MAESHAVRPRPAGGGVGDLSDLAPEPDLAEGHQIGGQRPVLDRRRQRQGQGQIGGGLDHPDTPDGRDEDVGAHERHPGTLLEHGQQQRQPAGVHPLGRAPAAVPAMGVFDARACTSTNSARWPSMAGSTALPGAPGRRSPEQQLVGVGHRARPASPISNRPSSPVGPNRCLVARTVRSA